MKYKCPHLPDSAAVLLALCLLLTAGLTAVLSSGGEFSDWERRYLADAPSTPDLEDWETDQEVETFLADHIPFRNELVAADSVSKLLIGQNTQLNAWYVSGAVIEQPVNSSNQKVERNLDRFSTLAGKAGVPWFLLTPPTHGWLLREEMSPLMAARYEQEGTIYDTLATCEQAVQITDAFKSAPQDMYYSTDHHWTLQGAYEAYCALAEPLGYTPQPLEEFHLSEFPGFRGTTLARSGLPPFGEDTLHCAEPDSPVTLTIMDDETVYDHLIFPEAAQTYDGYAVYLNGNHGMLVIERPSAPEGTLVVYKDSFANCLLPLLSQHFSRIIAVDARYYNGMFSGALSMADDIRAILYVYSLDSLVNDTSIIRKAR